MHRRVGYSNYDGKIAGLYDLEETLGRGHFAVVKLARHVFTGEKVAVKVIDKSKLDEVSRSHLFQEVRCMKLVQHPNVVRLYEVIDTQTKLYLILELGDGGDLYDYIMRHDSGLGEEIARTYFRQIVRAISYCHRLHVVHRDLKPENVVFFEKLGTVKLTDFGFSNKFCPGQKLETSCGSLAYSAPEILLGDSYDAPAVDVWSLGVILYMLVCGQAPFQEANDSETLTMIMDCKYSIPAHVSDGCKRLIARMLVREPEGRATLEEIAADPWLSIGSDADPVEALPLVSRQQVSDDHHNLIINKMVNGNIATKEEIVDALDRNEYNHITATYFLLAERKLRAHRQEQMQKHRPELLDVSTSRRTDLTADVRTDQAALSGVNQSLLSVPRTPGDVPQNVRTRKCSIVQEEEDEDDVSSCSGRDDRGSNSALNSFNRRGSRSEGKLSHILQERLSQLPEKHKHPATKVKPVVLDERIRANNKEGDTIKTNDEIPLTKRTIQASAKEVKEEKNRLGNNNNTGQIWSARKHQDTAKPKSVTECLMKQTAEPLPSNKWRMGSQHHRPSSLSETGSKATTTAIVTTTTTILTESSTVSIPIRAPVLGDEIIPKYKTMPSPGTDAIGLNEILEDGDIPPPNSESRSRVVRRIGYEQRRSKFHKTRTTSCSSSDASDDDSESRKKRAHKIGASAGKPALPARRDSHDDSSDSQDPGGSNCRSAGGNSVVGTRDNVSSENQNDGRGTQSSTSNTTTTTTNSGGNGKRHCNENQTIVFGRRYRAGRRRAGETRLRESQSLNRITEVQEAEAPSYHTTHISRSVLPPNSSNVSNNNSNSNNSDNSQISSTQHSQTVNNNNNNNNVVEEAASRNNGGASVQKAKGFGARLLQWSLNTRKAEVSQEVVHQEQEKKGLVRPTDRDKENRQSSVRTECKNRKLRLLTRYFAVHKKLCVPLPGIFAKGRLYKARSCGNIVKDRVTPPSPKSMLLCTNADDKWRERSGQQQQQQQQQQQWCNNDLKCQHRGSDGDINQNLGLAQFVQDTVGKSCTGLATTVCHIHLGDASKCCSLC